MKGRILVVDDFQPNRELLRRRLVSAGHEVFEVADGIEALNTLSKESVDVVLLDILMPKMTGYEVLDAMRHHADMSGIPVIIITAVEQIDSIVKCIEMGADDYLTKPFNPVLLKARINAALEKKALHDQARLYLLKIEEEKKRLDDVLNEMMPSAVVEELKKTGTIVPKLHQNVAIMFCDVVDFTLYCKEHPPEEVLKQLQELFDAYENLTNQYGLEKIKTNGDEFMCASGLNIKRENPVRDCVDCGLKMAEITNKFKPHWQVRIGIHVGPVIAGVVGQKRFTYDIWGDTVNIASKVCEQAKIGGVSLSQEACAVIKNHYEIQSLGNFPIKGKGEIELFTVKDQIAASKS